MVTILGDTEFAYLFGNNSFYYILLLYDELYAFKYCPKYALAPNSYTKSNNFLLWFCFSQNLELLTLFCMLGSIFYVYKK